jgi:hypothetical protein
MLIMRLLLRGQSQQGIDRRKPCLEGMWKFL